MLEVTQWESKVKFKGICHGRWNLIFFSGVVGGSGTCGGLPCSRRKELSLSLNHHKLPQSHGVSSSYSAPRTTTLDQAKTTYLLSTELRAASANPFTGCPSIHSQGDSLVVAATEGQSLLKTFCSFHTHFGPPTQLHPYSPHRLTVPPAYPYAPTAHVNTCHPCPGPAHAWRADITCCNSQFLPCLQFQAEAHVLGTGMAHGGH